MTQAKQHPAWVYVAFPAIAMLLGWGLRGYIGGGPFGAMIPGCYVALSVCLLMGYRAEMAAIAALFGAIGIGYGGDMTYGQTLGFLKSADTVWWGLLGCAVKGGVWGLLGGAVLGIGLTRDRYEQKTIALGFAITVVAFYAGWKLINEPRLIYFSDPINKPRAESWAGLLFAAIALLAYVRNRARGGKNEVPLRFALWGMVGGALGFGGGALWMVLGEHVPRDFKWLEWWKMMEFSFGLIFGAALGYCAYLNRDRLRVSGQSVERVGTSWAPVIEVIALVAAVFGLEMILVRSFGDSGEFANVVLRDTARVFFSFIFFGAVCIVLGMRSLHAAWQIAITLTFFHTVLDLVLDMSDIRSFGYTAPGWVQIMILLVSTALVGALVYRMQRGPRAVQRLYLLAIWSCFITATARSFARTEYLFPTAGENAMSVLLTKDQGMVFVHGTFTISALITTWFIVSRFQDVQEHSRAVEREST